MRDRSHLPLLSCLPGSKTRKIPYPTKNPFTWLFLLVSCPNYTYEVRVCPSLLCSSSRGGGPTWRGQPLIGVPGSAAALAVWSIWRWKGQPFWELGLSGQACSCRGLQGQLPHALVYSRALWRWSPISTPSL